VPAVVVGGHTDDCGVVAGLGEVLFALSGAVVPFGIVPCCGVYGSAFGICGCVTGAVVDGVAGGVVVGGVVVVVVGVVGEVVAGGVATGAANAAPLSSTAPTAALQTREILFISMLPFFSAVPSKGAV
jgi:hypothetical protein